MICLKCYDPNCPWCYPEREEDRYFDPDDRIDRRDRGDDQYFDPDGRRDRKDWDDDSCFYPDRRKDKRDMDDDIDYAPEWRNDPKDDDKHHDRKKPSTQTHVHEYAGSTMLAGKIIHNHRLAGVTSEAIPYGKSHIHAILDNTDFFFNHYHEIGVKTGPAIPVGEGRHIHFVKGKTTLNFGHDHDFIFTTFIENSIEGDRKNFQPE